MNEHIAKAQQEQAPLACELKFYMEQGLNQQQFFLTMLEIKLLRVKGEM